MVIGATSFLVHIVVRKKGDDTPNLSFYNLLSTLVIQGFCLVKEVCGQGLCGCYCLYISRANRACPLNVKTKSQN